MKYRLSLAVLAVLSVLLVSHSAAAQSPRLSAPQPPLQIVHHGEVAVPANHLFRELENRFVGGWLGAYQIVRKDPKTRTLVVRRGEIDSDNWTRWAYCKMGPLDLLDSLRDGTATITIKLEPARKTTFTTALADFEGTYGLASSTKTVQCLSRGVLEDELLATIAAEEQQRSQRVAQR
jgi:hypothetical protein